MIQANDLRLGNWVAFNDNTDRYGKVIKVTASSVDLSTEYVPDHSENAVREVGLNIESVFPIDLSPEILEKAGFETLSVGSGDTSYWQQHKPDVEFVLRWFVIDERIEWEGIKISYVHQLQNLYFALTGEELQIEL